MSKSFLSRFLLNPFSGGKPASRQAPDVEQLFNGIHADTREPLLTSLRRMLEPAQAEEVLQEAYLKLLLALREDRAPEPRAFLYRVARNEAISRLRHQKVVEERGAQVQLAMPAHHEAVESRISREQEQGALLAAINALPLKCRQVFVMRKIDGLSHGQIAEVLGISTKTVENHLARGMRLCRNHIVAGGLHQATGETINTQQVPAREGKVAAG
ncbi:RNA polymerase sigma factor [Microbulbifer sp. JSM ZJ756]|uniref:RNA polymerase sigma factor n=1 Tax=Microbulbifer sp. JSM ZJ756 TaxID=3376191 RepID=UPI0037B1506D